MTDRKPSDDLTTEQILESINRIVSEGESRGRSTSAGAGVPPLAPPPPPKRTGSQDVLDLVDVVDEQGNVLPPGKAAEGRPAFSFPPRGEPPPRQSAAPGKPPPRQSAQGSRPTDAQVLEALKPMLQTWLDTHMPPMVKRLVKQELERASQRSEPE